MGTFNAGGDGTTGPRCTWITGMTGDMQPVMCAEPARFRVERDDSEPGFEPAGSCPRHLPDVLPNLLAGHPGVHAFVTVHWDTPGGGAR